MKNLLNTSKFGSSVSSIATHMSGQSNRGLSSGGKSASLKSVKEGPKGAKNDQKRR